MKIPQGMSKKVTHTLIIADRSEAGMAAVDRVLEIVPAADERITAWRNSTDGFMFFVMEEADGGRFGALPAKDLSDMLSKIEELFDTHLLPPANPTFDIYVAPPDNKTIHDHAATACHRGGIEGRRAALTGGCASESV